MLENKILMENVTGYVFDTGKRYEVRRNAGATYSELDSAYVRDTSGLSLAKARLEYLEKSTREE